MKEQIKELIKENQEANKEWCKSNNIEYNEAMSYIIENSMLYMYHESIKLFDNSDLIKDIKDRIKLITKKQINNYRISNNRIEPDNLRSKAFGKSVAYEDEIRNLQSILNKLK